MSPAKKTPRKVLRIIDANLNRSAEGLRLLEEIARLMLDNSTLTQQLKNMRHELVTGSSSFQQELLRARDSADDVGVDMEVPGEGKERELSLVLVANSRRVQESLRTLEELSKLSEIVSELDSEKFKQARFDLYAIEKKLMSELSKKAKLEREK